MGNVLYGPGIEEAWLHGLHRLLIARGWSLSPYSVRHVDEHGLPWDPEAAWQWPAPVAVNDIENAPEPLVCAFEFRSGGPIVRVTTAGNDRGCDEHDRVDHYFELTGGTGAPDFTALAGGLGTFEDQARAVDVRALLECMFLGECGRQPGH